MEFINYSNISLGKEAIAVPIAIGIARGKAKNHSK